MVLLKQTDFFSPSTQPLQIDCAPLALAVLPSGLAAPFRPVGGD